MLRPLPSLSVAGDPFVMQNMLNEYFLTKDMDIFKDFYKRPVINWFHKVDSGEWNYDLCILEEFGELIGCLPVAHYRSQIMTAAQEDNAVMELVDLQHFVLSKVLYELWSLGEVTEEHHNRAVNPIRLGEIPDVVFAGEVLTPENLKVDLVRCLIHTIDHDSYQDVLRQFYRLIYFVSHYLQITPADLFRIVQDIYKLKFRLNVFRQFNGAQVGAYKKKIGGVEDNAVMLHSYCELAGATSLKATAGKNVPVTAAWENFETKWIELELKNG